jgi:hypothetical protein
MDKQRKDFNHDYIYIKIPRRKPKRCLQSFEEKLIFRGFTAGDWKYLWLSKL